MNIAWKLALITAAIVALYEVCDRLKGPVFFIWHLELISILFLTLAYFLAFKRGLLVPYRGLYRVGAVLAWVLLAGFVAGAFAHQVRPHYAFFDAYLIVGLAQVNFRWGFFFFGRELNRASKAAPIPPALAPDEAG